MREVSSYRVFQPGVERSTEETSPWVPQAQRDVTEVDPDTQVQEIPISMSTDESICATFCVLLYETPLALWMFCLYNGVSILNLSLSMQKSNESSFQQ